MRQQKQLSAKTLWGVIFWPLFLLAVTPLVLAAPAHADDNTISIEVKNKNAVLAPPQSKNDTLYKATTDIEVTTGKPYGFNLTMQADTADLINSKDPTHKISAISSTAPSTLNVNQWGYALDKQANEFARVPAHNGTPAVIVDTSVKGKQADCNCKDQCATSVTFAANIDPTSLATGTYSATVTYTATAKPAPKPPVVDPTICKSGDPKSDCQVDLDPNMIPVIYTGNAYNAEWTSIKWPENPHDPGAWYNYNQKKWANAVTVRNPSKYKGERRVVDKDDILGFWVYIPRYAYEVMRRDVTDAPVPAQNFTIHFEKSTDPKRYPAESQCAGRNMDYRTTCGLNRDYIKGQPSEQGTWATHPAFTFGKKELNGIWFAKFETTGSSQQPTILPNERAMSWDSAVEFIGNKYVTATTLGVKDPQNTGGNDNFTPPDQNSHHLANLSSRMPKNTDWGAVSYLSASQFGAGYKGVQLNAALTYDSNHDSTCDSKFGGSESRCSDHVTGCGPVSGGNGKEVYRDVGSFGQQSACSKSNLQRAYNGSIGQLASTTNNPTGVYDMAGGGWEYVAASYTDDADLINSSTETEHKSMLTPAHKPYVDLYNFGTFAKCTWATCGGQATYETINKFNDSWGAWNRLASFAPGVYSNGRFDWVGRGSSAWNISVGWTAGIFLSNSLAGRAGNGDSLRVVLSSRPV